MTRKETRLKNLRGCAHCVEWRAEHYGEDGARVDYVVSNYFLIDIRSRKTIEDMKDYATDLISLMDEVETPYREEMKTELRKLWKAVEYRKFIKVKTHCYKATLTEEEAEAVRKVIGDKLKWR